MDYIRIKLPEGRSVARQHNPTVATLQTEVDIIYIYIYIASRRNRYFE